MDERERENVLLVCRGGDLGAWGRVLDVNERKEESVKANEEGRREGVNFRLECVRCERRRKVKMKGPEGGAGRGMNCGENSVGVSGAGDD